MGKLSSSQELSPETGKEQPRLSKRLDGLSHPVLIVVSGIPHSSFSGTVLPRKGKRLNQEHLRMEGLSAELTRSFAKNFPFKLWLPSTSSAHGPVVLQCLAWSSRCSPLSAHLAEVTARKGRWVDQDTLVIILMQIISIMVDIVQFIVTTKDTSVSQLRR